MEGFTDDADDRDNELDVEGIDQILDRLCDAVLASHAIERQISG